MLLFVTILHLILCFILMLVILLQPGKGADVGAAFGGGISTSVFGARGTGNILSKATTVVAALFMVTSITLALYSNSSMRSGTDIQDEILRLQQQESEQSAPQDLPPTTDVDDSEQSPSKEPGALQQQEDQEPATEEQTLPSTDPGEPSSPGAVPDEPGVPAELQ